MAFGLFVGAIALWYHVSAFCFLLSYFVSQLWTWTIMWIAGHREESEVIKKSSLWEPKPLNYGEFLQVDKSWRNYNKRWRLVPWCIKTIFVSTTNFEGWSWKKKLNNFWLQKLYPVGKLLRNKLLPHKGLLMQTSREPQWKKTCFDLTQSFTDDWETVSQEGKMEDFLRSSCRKIGHRNVKRKLFIW